MYLSEVLRKKNLLRFDMYLHEVFSPVPLLFLSAVCTVMSPLHSEIGRQKVKAKKSEWNEKSSIARERERADSEAKVCGNKKRKEEKRIPPFLLHTRNNNGGNCYCFSSFLLLLLLLLLLLSFLPFSIPLPNFAVGNIREKEAATFLLSSSFSFPPFHSAHVSGKRGKGKEEEEEEKVSVWALRTDGWRRRRRTERTAGEDRFHKVSFET